MRKVAKGPWLETERIDFNYNNKDFFIINSISKNKTQVMVADGEGVRNIEKLMDEADEDLINGLRKLPDIARKFIPDMYD